MLKLSRLLSRIGPATGSAVRAAFAEIRPRQNWKGIYRSFAEVGDARTSFDAEAWASAASELAERTIARNAAAVPAEVYGDEALLPLMAALLANDAVPVRIVDFGGGAGVSYANVRAALQAGQKLDYTVVELPAVARAGQDLFSADPAVRFVSEIPKPGEPIDIVFISTALQYVEDWKGLLRDLTNLRPRYFLFSRLSAGDIPTFVTAQVNYRNDNIPYRFISLDELKFAMKPLGNEILLAGTALDRIDQNEFPSGHRLSNACNLLFSRPGE